ncbi:MAG TPA: hypothetical protein VFU07_03305 [Candidatus Lumbricidophila sp.]|nr:hypothetical protein [Candidatus Lumbricidophila sp.]
MQQLSVTPGRSLVRSWLGGRLAIWIAFVLVHALLIWLNLNAPGAPLGDVKGVYRDWAMLAASELQIRMGIDTPWVYPILAFLPITGAWVLGRDAYPYTWLAMVTVLNAVALEVLLGRGVFARGRRWAGWFWVVFLGLLGPIALGRLDTVTVPIVIIGLLYALGRPNVAAVLLTIAAWVKVWPAAVLAALVIVSGRRRLIVTVAIALSAIVVSVSLVAGSGFGNAFGFVLEQSDRGLQVEAPMAVPWLWAIVLHIPGVMIKFSPDILTFQIEGPGAGVAARLTTPLLALGTLVLLWFGIRAARRGAHAAELLVPLSLGFVTMLMLCNKVGSPQFVSWLAAPVILGIVLHRRKSLTPVILVLAIAALTQGIFPYVYRWLLWGHMGMVMLVTAKAMLLAILLGWAIRSVWHAGRAPRLVSEGE